MARQSTIDTHPQREKIIDMITMGTPAVDIARTYPGVSVYAISRYKVKRKDALTSILSDDGIGPAEVVGRLADLADSARIARRLTDASQSPAVRTRTITTELSVLDRLAKLAITDMDTARLAEATGPLVKVIQHLADVVPHEVLAELEKFPSLTELKTALKAQTGQRS